MSRSSMALVLLLSALGLACSAASGAPGPAAEASPPRALVPSGTPVVIADEHGFTPGAVTLAKGGPGAIVFRRTSDDTCATAVVFPELGIERELPRGVDVGVFLPAGVARTFVFQCGMGMYRSQVVVR